MGTKELQIGDWCRSKNFEGIYIYSKVVALDSRTGKILLENRWIETDTIEPIPLTDEILEKNGFVKQYNGYGNDFVLPRMYSHISPFKVFECFDGWGSKVVGYGITVSGATEDINFVHELQHALKFCKFSKVLEDFKI